MILMAGACAGDTTADDEPAADATTAALTREIVLAVEQWPECLNPITSCANATWLTWSVLVHLLPGLLEFDPANVLRASPMVEAMPSQENGGVVVNDDGSFTVTYRISPDARWSDGTPITSADVHFTWRAILDTQGSLQTIGYDLVTGVDTEDPRTAVISFSKSYAPWPYMFHNLLPAHAFDGNTDISGYWNDAIPISGGPWVQESWNQEQQVLVPNENYWVPERMPLVDRVVMVPREDTDSEVVALQTGEVMAAMPQPFPGAKDRLVGDLTFVDGPGNHTEGLWFNQIAPDRRFEITTNVRRAVAYALDREQIVEVALGSIIDDPSVLQCAGWNPALGDWCGDDFSHYRQDMEAVNELLVADGWTRPDPDGLWVNADGDELVIQWNTVAGNKRREDVQALVSEMTAPFGIGWEIINYDAGELFQNRLPAMNFGPVALYAAPTYPDPSVTEMYDIEGIPSEPNGYSGQNFMAYASQAATDLAFAIDEEIDPAARLELVAELGELLAADVPWIPLYVLPNLLVWNTTLVEGPGEWVSSVYGGFYDIYDWTVAG
jgi:peptide/nickel transport system substrate-binding protein